MANWLLKIEPSCFSWHDLVKQKNATWDGVANATALIHIRNMKKGDTAIIYHTGDERRAVGLAQITSNPYPDPKENDPRLVVVDLKPKSPLPHPVPLDIIKADKAFQGWDLLRISRLSVVPTSDKMFQRLLDLGQTEHDP
jgi:predicted RNA-binding protein with PUA-like domain